VSQDQAGALEGKPMIGSGQSELSQALQSAQACLSNNHHFVDIQTFPKDGMRRRASGKLSSVVGEPALLPAKATCAKLTRMSCSSCGQRKGRRECPALGATICAICCGTKRLVEIRCPPSCSHLATAREHPAAVVKRQHERDLALLLPTISHLTERQHQLFFLVHSIVARHEPDALSRLLDKDVADAAGAVASTLETAGRGVLYEHTPASLPAQRLAREITAAIAEIRELGTKIYDGELAITLRAIERGATDLHKQQQVEDTAYLSLIGRLLQFGGQPPGEETPTPASSLILP
jgi:hypothetical protein